jgi:hypothetical protein
LIIEDIVTQHAEAAFLWHLRNIAISRPDYNLKDLTELDDRVDAHLDGLRRSRQQGGKYVKNR